MGSLDIEKKRVGGRSRVRGGGGGGGYVHSEDIENQKTMRKWLKTEF